MPTLGLWLAVGAWSTLCLVGIRRHFRTPRVDIAHAHGLLAAALILALIAPYVSLVVHHLTGAAPWAGLGPLVGAAACALFARQLARRSEVTAVAEQTYREKSAALICVALVALTFGAASAVLAFDVELVAAAIAAIVLLIVVGIVGHTVLAVMHHPIEETDDPLDERDREVGLRATRNACYLLGAGVWTILLAALFGLPGPSIAVISLVVITAAEIVYYGSLVRYYRAGVV